MFPTESVIAENGSAPFVPELSYEHTNTAHDRAAKFDAGVTTSVF